MTTKIVNGDQAFISDPDSYKDITKSVWNLINTSLIHF
jgi:hypothetical protein